MTQFTFHFLGQFQVHAESHPVTDFHSDKARSLLAYLVLESQEHTRVELATLLWPEIDDKYARTNLRNTLHRLRQTLDAAAPNAADQLLTVTRQTVQFNPATTDIDVTRFQMLLKNANASATTNLDQIGQAVALYQGELLAHFGVADAQPFEEWLLLRRELLHQQALLAFRSLTAGYEAMGNYDEAHAVASQLIALDPYREDSYRQIMRLLAQMGRSDQALQYLEQVRQILHTELGVEPSEQTLALAREIAADNFEGVQAWQGEKVIEAAEVTPSPKLDLSDVPDPGPFFGRVAERQQIAQWLLKDRCRIVAILAIGGMGKTTLAAQSIRELATEATGPFDTVLWRSLVNAPPLAELLPPLLQTLSAQKLTEIPDGIDSQLRLLLGYLRDKRVLLVLDNMESILDPEQAGTYRSGYESYGQLIQQVATLEHQSHLLLTSRERPRGYGRLERDSPLIQSLQLAGLDDVAGHELLVQRGLSGEGEEEAMLIVRYSGNPLALKLVADTVDEIFGGDLTEFLADDSIVFDDIRSVLDQHFARLTELEQQILFWLAVEREAIPISHLNKNFLYPPVRRVLIEALNGLQRRSLVERAEHGFTLQNVVTEYLTDRLVAEICQEVESGDTYLLHRQALLKAKAKEYVRQSQDRLILAPIAQQLIRSIGHTGIEQQVRQILAKFRDGEPRKPSYAGGNLLNLLLHLAYEVQGFDFSCLSVRHVNLRGMSLSGLNLGGADLSDSVFTDMFASVFATAFSPNGELLAAGTANGEVRLWRVADRQLITVFKGGAGPAWSVAFSPDSKTLASGCGDPNVYLWNVENGAMRQLIGHTVSVRTLAFSPDGYTLASGSEDCTVRLWDLQASPAQAQVCEGHEDWVYSLAFSPDGALLASGSGDHTVRLWDLRSPSTYGSLHAIFRRHTKNVLSVAFSPQQDGSAYTLASGGLDKNIHLWRINLQGTVPSDTPISHQQPFTSWEGDGGWKNALVFSPDGQLLIGGGQGGQARIWNMHTQQVQNILSGDTNSIRSLDVSPMGNMFVSGSMDQTIRLWETASGQLLHTIQGYSNWAMSLAFCGDDETVVSGGHDGTLRFWPILASPSSDSLDDDPPTDNSVADNRLSQGSSEDAAVHYGLHHGLCYDQLVGHTGWVMDIAISPDGKSLVSASVDKSVRIWTLASSKQDAERYGIGWLRHTLAAHQQGALSVAFSPDSTLFASGGADSIVYLWDVATGQLRNTLRGHTNWIWALAFSPDGKTLASASSDQTIRLWHTQTGEVRHTLHKHSGWVRDVAFSPDGRILASGSEDNTVRLWDVASGFEENVLYLDDSWVMAAVFCPNAWPLAENQLPNATADYALASGTVDGVIHLWDLTRDDSGINAQLRCRLEGHASRIETLTCSRNGRILASGSSDQTIKVWDSETSRCIQTLQMPGPYQGTNITGVTGISEAQRTALKALGAVENDG